MGAYSAQHDGFSVCGIGLSERTIPANKFLEECHFEGNLEYICTPLFKGLPVADSGRVFWTLIYHKKEGSDEHSNFN